MSFWSSNKSLFAEAGTLVNAMSLNLWFNSSSAEGELNSEAAAAVFVAAFFLFTLINKTLFCCLLSNVLFYNFLWSYLETVELYGENAFGIHVLQVFLFLSTCESIESMKLFLMMFFIIGSYRLWVLSAIFLLPLTNFEKLLGEYFDGTRLGSMVSNLCCFMPFIINFGCRSCFFNYVSFWLSWLPFLESGFAYLDFL